MADDAKTIMQMNIPEKFIADAIRAEIVKSLTNKDALIARVVEQAMSGKVNSYDNKTIWAQTVEQMIRDEANLIFKEWVVAQREAIKKALLDHLSKSKGAVIKQIAEKMAAGMQSYRVSVSLDIPNT